MTPRSIRRAAERKRVKEQARQERNLARNAESETTLEANEPDLMPVPEAPVPSPAQLAANRANAQFSTGPRSLEGKVKSSLNAVKTALTGRTVLLPTDDAAQYERYVLEYFAEYRPAGDRESELVQSLADTQWRLNRIPALEMGIYALARIEFKDMFEEQEPAVRAALIEAHTFIAYQKQLNNLSIQESRLRRQYQHDLAELKESQNARVARRQPLAKPAPQPASAVIGFDFSSADSGHATSATDSLPHPAPGTLSLPQAA